MRRPKRYNPLWHLMIKPVSENRYNPREFHVGMFNYWTNEVCDDHPHESKI